MAKYTIEVTKQRERVETLEFLGKIFTDTISFHNSIEDMFPDTPKDIIEIAYNLYFDTYKDVEEYIRILSDYEIEQGFLN